MEVQCKYKMSKSPLRKLALESNEIYEPLWRSNKRYIISIGGRGGARSYENSQKIIGRLTQTRERFRAALMRAVHADIRHSIWQECVDRVEEHEVPGIDIVSTTMEMVCGKNSVHAHGFKKSSADRTAKLKSLAGYTDAFIEEGEEIAEADFQQLDDSLRAEGSKIHISLNTPPRTHWIVKRWFNLTPHPEAPGFYTISLKPEYEHEVEVIFSDHTKNPYLAKEVHRRYEAYRTTKPSYYWHMIRGLAPEVVTGRIYAGWNKIDSIPHEARLLGYGLDFGYDPDPAAIVAVYYHNGGYILDERLYQTQLLDEQLATNINAYPKSLVIADSAEPKAIEGLRRRGINILPVTKGQDSVQFGIKHVQGLRISYTSSSKNLEAEYENYAWKRDKDSVEEDDHLGIEDPSCANHLMSAARYALTMLVKPSRDYDGNDTMFRLETYIKPSKTNPAL